MKRKVIRNIVAYVCTPLLYCAVCCLITAVAVYPFTKDMLSAASLIISDGNTGSSNGVSDDGIVSLSDITDGILNASDVHFPNYGEQLGNITVSGENGVSVNANLYFGDDSAQLKSGAGVFMGSSLPGYGSTVLIAGHNHTWFKPLKYASVGDTVTITTYYGVYVYEITDIQVKQVSDKSHYDLLADHENLVMYTCYPFGSIGMTPTRYFIYGKYVSGPMVNVRK